MHKLMTITLAAAAVPASVAFAQEAAPAGETASATRVVAIHIKDQTAGTALSADPRGAARLLVTRGIDSLMQQLEASGSANVLYEAEEPAGVASWELREQRSAGVQTTPATTEDGQRSSVASADSRGFVMARQEPAEEGMRRLSLSLEAPIQPAASAVGTRSWMERLNFTGTIDPADYPAVLVHSVHGHDLKHDALLTAVGPATVTSASLGSTPGKLLQVSVLRIPTSEKEAVMGELMTLSPDTTLVDLNGLATRTTGELVYHALMPAALDKSLRFTTSTDTSQQQSQQVGASSTRSQFDLRDSLSVMIRPDQGALKYFEVQLDDAHRTESILMTRSAEWKGTRTFGEQPFVSAVDVRRDTASSSPDAPEANAQSYVLVMRVI